MKARLPVFLAALWWGSLTSLGFIVVPMLFASLGTPAVAGAMAAKLFTAQTWLGTACAMLLLLAANQKRPEAHVQSAHPAIKFIVAGLLLALVGEFGIAARIVNARAEGGNLKLWHGLGTGVYVVQWLCAGVSFWHLAGESKAAATVASATDEDPRA